MLRACVGVHALLGARRGAPPPQVALYVHYDAPDERSRARVASLELSLVNQAGGADLTRKHEGQRVFGAKADAAKRV